MKLDAPKATAPQAGSPSPVSPVDVTLAAPMLEPTAVGARVVASRRDMLLTRSSTPDTSTADRLIGTTDEPSTQYTATLWPPCKQCVGHLARKKSCDLSNLLRSVICMRPGGDLGAPSCRGTVGRCRRCDTHAGARRDVATLALTFGTVRTAPPETNEPWYCGNLECPACCSCQGNDATPERVEASRLTRTVKEGTYKRAEQIGCL